MVEAAEDRGFRDRPADGRWFGRAARNLLADALVRPGVVEIGAVVLEDKAEVILATDEHVVVRMRVHGSMMRSNLTARPFDTAAATRRRIASLCLLGRGPPS